MRKNHFYIVVDFNIKLLITETIANFIKCITSFYFKPQITRPTRLSIEGNYSSMIDNNFINSNNESISVTICYDISGYLPIYYCANDNNNNILKN